MEEFRKKDEKRRKFNYTRTKFAHIFFPSKIIVKSYSNKRS